MLNEDVFQDAGECAEWQGPELTDAYDERSSM